MPLRALLPVLFAASLLGIAVPGTAAGSEPPGSIVSGPPPASLDSGPPPASLDSGPPSGVVDLGVGAFEVARDGAILWTRVERLVPGRRAIPVRVEVATDDAFTRVVKRRRGKARPGSDDTVRIRVDRLEPATEYWYRFQLDDRRDGKGKKRKVRKRAKKKKSKGKGAVDRAPSAWVTERVGRFRTAPTPDATSPVRFVISGDSNLGYTRPRGLDFFVLSAAAAEDPDFFVFFGDTIYSDSGVLPGGGDAVTLDEYREVHRLTRADPHMRRLIGSTGTFTGWDDHEVRNDYAGETVEPERFRNGARAFFEYLPLRERPPRREFRTDRTVRWGRHLELFFLDGRQFRSAEVFCNPDPIPDGPATPDSLFSPYPDDDAFAMQLLPPSLFAAAEPLLTPNDPECVENLLGAPGRSYLGRAQLERLKRDLLASTATFKVIVNNTPLSDLLFQPYDRWEGYDAERQELLAFAAEHLDPDRTLVITTDFHINLGVRRAELTELLVGPIGQSTFGSGVMSLLPPELADQGGIVLAFLSALIDQANGGGTLLGSVPDAFSYAVVEVFETAEGEPRLRAVVRGDADYARGANDPGKVGDLFSFELP